MNSLTFLFRFFLFFFFLVNIQILRTMYPVFVFTKPIHHSNCRMRYSFPIIQLCAKFNNIFLAKKFLHFRSLSVHLKIPDKIRRKKLYTQKKNEKFLETPDFAFDIIILSKKSAKNTNNFAYCTTWNAKCRLVQESEQRERVHYRGHGSLVKSRLYRSNVTHWLANWRFIHTVEAMNCFHVLDRTPNMLLAVYRWRLDGRRIAAILPKQQTSVKCMSGKLCDAMHLQPANPDTLGSKMEIAMWAHTICWRSIVVVWRANMCVQWELHECACKQ